MKIINLVEDTKGGICQNEHGLSFYVETKKHKLLSDCGATDMFIRNAELLGVDLSKIDVCALSHGHYDHSGGLLNFAELNSKAAIYLRENADGDYYNASAVPPRYIGIDKNIMNLPQTVKVSGNLLIDDELFLFGDFKKNCCPLWSNSLLKQKIGGQYKSDDFLHEQCLVIVEGDTQVLISGCAHNGILSITDRYFELFGRYPNVVISGFHMMKKSEYTQEESDCIKFTANELLKTDSLFYTGHCTGKPAFDIMKKIMGDKLRSFYSGSQIIV